MAQIDTYMDWSQLNNYICPIPGCKSPMEEIQDRTIHKCSSCSFRISEEKLSNMVVLRHRKLEPPEFIKDMQTVDNT